MTRPGRVRGRCAWLEPVTTTTFCERVRNGDVVYGGWLSVPSAVSARALAGSGVDYVCIDLQHGGATEHDLPELTSAIRLAGAAPLGRVRHAHPADIGRALDLGCDGVIVPNVDSAEQARSVVGGVPVPAGRLPVRGRRCWPPPSCRCAS